MAYDPYNPPTMSMGRRRGLAAYGAPLRGASQPDLTGLDPGWGIIRQRLAEAKGQPSYYSREMARRGLNGPQIPGGLAAYASQGYGVGSGQQPMGLAAHAGHGYADPAAMQGALYQGATPGLVAYSGGMRPGFLAPPAEESGVHIRDIRGRPLGSAGLASAGMEMGPAAPSSAGPRGLAGMTLSGVTGMGQNQYANYQQRMGTPDDPSAYAMNNRANYLASRGGAGGRQQVLDRVALRRQNKVDAAQSEMEAANPQYGLAMAHLRMQQGIEQGRLGVQREGLAAQERTATAGLASREKIAGGEQSSRREIAGLQAEQARLAQEHEMAAKRGDWQTQREIAAAHEQNAIKLKEMEGENARGLAKEQQGPLNRKMDIEEKQLARQRIDSLRQQASDAYRSNNVQRGQQIEAQINQEEQALAPQGLAGMTGAMPGAAPAAMPPASGGMASGLQHPQSLAQVPHEITTQLHAAKPEQRAAMIAQMYPGISQTAIDTLMREIARDPTVTEYDPGGYGLSNALGSLLGTENISRFITGKGRAPRMDYGYNIPILRSIPRPVIPGPLGVGQSLIERGLAPGY